MHLSYGATLRPGPELAECHYSTISKMLKRDDEFAATVKKLRQQPIVDALHALRVASRKQWRAPAHLLAYLERREELARNPQREERRKWQARLPEVLRLLNAVGAIGVR